jgi:hypothetical protein
MMTGNTVVMLWECTQTGLYLHGIYEAGRSEKAAPRWADPKTGLSPEVRSEECAEEENEEGRTENGEP